MTLEEKEQLIGRLVCGLCVDLITDKDVYADLHSRLVKTEKELAFYKRAYDKVANDYNTLAEKAGV